MTNMLLALAPKTAPELPAAGIFEVVGRDSPSRQPLEERIRAGYGKNFGASIARFMPFLLHYESSAGTGALGFRPAALEPLYLETYLESPVEVFLRNITRTQVARKDIVEVGQFVVDDRASAGAMFTDLAPFLACLGFEWIAFTATRQVRRMLAQTGLRGLTIASARQESVRNMADDWGNYYSHDPQVIIGSLRDPRGGWCSALQNHGRVLAAVE